jgi:hypothetical protein
MALDDFTKDNEYEEDAPGDKRWREAEPGVPQWPDDVSGIEKEYDGDDNEFVVLYQSDKDTMLRSQVYVSLSKMA